MKRLGFAKARTRHTPGKMNGIETLYSMRLDEMLHRGQIAAWDFEPEKLRLADRTYYDPDFRVVTNEGLIEFHECKACRTSGTVLSEDDARVKIKVAAETHWMYRFVGAYKLPKALGGGWKYEFFNSGDLK